MRYLTLSAIILSLPGLAVAQGDVIWIEGESARSSTMRRHGWYDDVTKESLSGGEWLSHFGRPRSGDAPEAEYAVEVEQAGEYALWIRCNTVARPKLSYRLDDGKWTELDVSKATQVVNIASDGKPDMRFVGWVEAGRLRLERGEREFRIRFESGNQFHGGVDCFVFSRGDFRPRGALRPGQRSGRANAGYFAWEPDVDRFEASALVDLRALNEDVAGRQGRVRSKGDGFVLGDGRAVKFWAVNAGPGIWELDHDAHVYLARRLAKLGVNMVRLHGSFYASRGGEIDRERLASLQHLVHALSQEGIYSTLSFFFPLWFHLDGDRRPFMLLFFDEEMQALHRGWARTLLKTRSPWSKKPLARENAVAIVEIVNEDSHFFWTFGKKNAPEERWRKLCEQFGAWLKKRHGSIDRAVETWGGVREADDDPAAGRAALYDAWAMTGDALRGAYRSKRRRVADQVRFLTENMRGFYAETIEFYEKDCGYRGLVSCGNWHVSDPTMLDALERYCYTAGDVIDHHGYFDHGHEGDASNYSVRPGHEFGSASALLLEHGNPLAHVQTVGHPHIVSEIGWPMPNAYRAEFPFLAATYGSLQGLDGVYAFALSGESWAQQMGKFTLDTPVGLGAFPAAALVYRRGDVAESEPVVLERIDVEDLYALKGSRATTRGSLDALRAVSIPEGRERRGPVEGIDPLSFWAGRVARSFDGKPRESVQRGLDDVIDREAKRVRSVTGELEWDWGKGVATMNTPRAKGAVGFLGRLDHDLVLGGVRVRMENDYGSITIVSLDDAPIERAGRILIQTLTVEQTFGFKASGERGQSGRIEDVGSAPWGVERVRATVSIELAGGADAREVVACDEHGYATEKRAGVKIDGSSLRIELESTSVYHVVRRR